ncbi:hypothetical protein SprV_0200734800 [Sparganum proliferum]
MLILIIPDRIEDWLWKLAGTIHFQPLDVVGPIPPSNGYTHLLAYIYRYTRWVEAIPLPNAQAETIVKAFFTRWVAIFGVPSTVTTGCGAQFESALFQTLLSFLGCMRIRTTVCHPAVNGMVERIHRPLKAVLCATENPGNWSDNLLLALLGIRVALESDLGCSAAELVCGTALGLPGEMVTPTSRSADETPDNFMTRLRQSMLSFFPEDLVSVDRVKVAVAEEPPNLPHGQDCASSLSRDPPPSLPDAPPPSQPSPTPLSSTASNPNSSNAIGILTTHSGRRVHFPDRLIT